MKKILLFIILSCYLGIADAQTSVDFNKFVGCWASKQNDESFQGLIIRKDGNDYVVSYKSVYYKSNCYGFDVKATIAEDKLICLWTSGVDNPSKTKWFISYSDATKKIKTTDPEAGAGFQDTYYSKVQ